MVYLAKGGFWLGFGQVISALLSFASSLFFANIISKDLYGNYKYIIATTSILGSISLSGMGAVVIQGVAQGAEGTLKDAVSTSLRWGSLTAIAALSTSLYYFSHHNTALGVSMLIAGASLPLTNAFSLYGSYLSGKKNFKRSTLYNTGSQIVTTAALIITAAATKSILAMVAVYFTLGTISILWAYRHVLSTYHLNDTRDHSLIPYSKHLSVMNLFSVVANQLDKILVFHYLGAINLAVYSFSQAIPEQVKGVFKSLFGIALPKYATLSEENMRASIKSKALLLTGLTVIVVFAYVLAAPFIFKLLFPKYLEAVLYSQIYMLGLITIPAISLFGIYFQLKKATEVLYKLTVIGNVATIILGFVLIYNFGLKGAVIENGASWAIMLFSNWYYFAKDTPAPQTLRPH
ncbi:MAG: Polysaccharide biosynthesis protein [Parcubacteria group bacterium]|nr:Polysaccharide biosynthesis protein [Parcubacteria group bacterium]